jgi:hypothetical protein
VAVYVDDMRRAAAVPCGGRRIVSRWSHLYADTRDELEAFARRIGLRPAWIQTAGPLVHYDLTDRRRHQAIKAGAVPVSWRQTGAFVRALRDRRAAGAA